MKQLQDLFFQLNGYAPTHIERMPVEGSNREYYRIFGKNDYSLIGVIGTSKEENDAFIYLSKHFQLRKLPVPEVLAVSNDGMSYLQSDLGTRSLFGALKGGRDAGGRYNEAEKRLLIKTIRELPNFQIRGARGLNFEKCYPQPAFDLEGVLFDLNYFKYCFLKTTHIDFNEVKLEASFRLMAKDLLSEQGDYFLYRDFQARNVMLDENDNPYFIDYQGGRRGPFYYDLASFLWQASAKYDDRLRQRLAVEYYDALKDFTEVPDERHFRLRLRLFVLFRTLQVLGAYGFRGYFEGKKHFIESIPPAIDNLRELLKDDEFPYPYLIEVLTAITKLPQFQIESKEFAARKDGYRTTDNSTYTPRPEDGKATFSKYDGQGPLVVRVFSFSFRKGIPDDESGNGGGYVFDCRSTHNPGRYEPYKHLTGLDEPVIRFLEDDGGILTFLESVYKLADAHVERYLKRGFTDLMFSFGCTGGQHRSVYSAQHLAEHLHSKYGIEVHICHREQNIKKILK